MTDDHGLDHNSPDAAAVAIVSQPADVLMSPSSPEFVLAASAHGDGGDAGRHR